MISQPHFLILGATGSIGYAVTTNLLARKLPVTILVRDRAKANALFVDEPTLTVIEGDVQDAALLRRIVMELPTSGPIYIFHGINYPYDQWFDNMDTATQKVIDAARLVQATVVFPGNVYNFGNTKEPIREDSRPNPNTRKGQLRVEVEAMLEQAANAGHCRVITIRLPDFWGPNVLNEGVRPVFENALTGKALPWLLNVEIPHQSAYTVDAAEIITQLILRDTPVSARKPYEVWNYGGVTVPSVREWFGQISALAGQPAKVQVHGRLIMTVLGLFMPVMREVKEMFYLYENTILLDDSAIRAAFPDFRPTPMKQALIETLTWFAEHQLKRSFTPALPAESVLAI